MSRRAAQESDLERVVLRLGQVGERVVGNVGEQIAEPAPRQSAVSLGGTSLEHAVAAALGGGDTAEQDRRLADPRLSLDQESHRPRRQ